MPKNANIICVGSLMKIRKYYVIFVYTLQVKMGKMEKKKENHATKVTKNQTTKIWDERSIFLVLSLHANVINFCVLFCLLTLGHKNWWRLWGCSNSWYSYEPNRPPRRMAGVPRKLCHAFTRGSLYWLCKRSRS